MCPPSLDWTGIQVPFEMEMAVIDVAVQEHPTNAFALITDGMKALLLREPERGIRRPNSDNLRSIHLISLFFAKNVPL
jgi:hypothetical protein